MKFTFFTVVAAVFAAHLSSAAIIPGGQSDADAMAIWDATAPYPGLLHMFRVLGIAMTQEQLSRYAATLKPQIREFIVTYLMQHYSKEMDKMLGIQLYIYMDSDIKSNLLRYLASHILGQKDIKELATQKGLDTMNVESLVASIKSSLNELLA